MLRVCYEKEFCQYADLAYELAIDKTRSAYPSYSDGIKTKAMFLTRSKKAFTRDNEEILLFEEEGIIKGWIHYYWLADDKYISTVSFNIANHFARALDEFIKLLGDRFSSYELYLGFSKENRMAIAYMANNDFKCIDISNNNTAFLDKYRINASNQDVVRINKDNYHYFSKLHQKLQGEMYWNTERIYADLDNWVILAKLKGNDVLGSIYYQLDDSGWFEIFGFDRKDGLYDARVHFELLSEAMNIAKGKGAEYMTYFCDDEEQTTVSKCGFELIDRYIGYKRCL